MLVINLWGGPCSGKSTSAGFLFSMLKNLGERAELVHEAAKRFIYKGAADQLKNQAYVMAKQYSAIEDLARSGCSVAISDSPLMLSCMYSENHSYYPELRALTEALDAKYKQRNIFCLRNKTFDGFGRTQKTLEEAAVYDLKARELMREMGKVFDLEAPGDLTGQVAMTKAVLEWLYPPSKDCTGCKDMAAYKFNELKEMLKKGFAL